MFGCNFLTEHTTDKNHQTKDIIMKFFVSKIDGSSNSALKKTPKKAATSFCVG